MATVMISNAYGTMSFKMEAELKPPQKLPQLELKYTQGFAALCAVHGGIYQHTLNHGHRMPVFLGEVPYWLEMNNVFRMTRKGLRLVPRGEDTSEQEGWRWASAAQVMDAYVSDAWRQLPAEIGLHAPEGVLEILRERAQEDAPWPQLFADMRLHVMDGPYGEEPYVAILFPDRSECFLTLQGPKLERPVPRDVRYQKMLVRPDISEAEVGAYGLH